MWNAGNRVRMDDWIIPGAWIRMVMCDIDRVLVGSEMMIVLRERCVVF